MSYSKPTTIAKLNDAILGCFAAFPPSEFIDHLVRYLGTWNGSDKLFAIVEYSLKLLIPLLNKRAKLQERAGLRKVATSATADRFAKFASSISDSRTLWRFWGLFTIIRWLISLEHNPQPTRKLLTIERLQGWSMLGYYPLEHLGYLVSHSVLPSRATLDLSPFLAQKRTIHLNSANLGVWSVRFWAVYVALQFAHLREDGKLLQARYKALRRVGLKPAEKEELKKHWEVYWSDLVVNLANFPLAIHWSTGSKLFKHDFITDFLNLIVAVTSFRTGWKATALPSSAPPLPLEPIDEKMEPPVAIDAPATNDDTAYDV